MSTYTHWRQLGPEHWHALERCCMAQGGRAQVDEDVAEPLLDLGWVEPRGYGYAPTPSGHRAHEGSPQQPPDPVTTAGIVETTAPCWRTVEPHPGPLRMLGLWLFA